MKKTGSAASRTLRSIAAKLPKNTLALLVVVVFGGVGSYLLTQSHAATPAASIEAEAGTVSTAASAITDTTASSGHAVKFGTSAGGGTGSCTGAANTPGGADPWGGCWPGPNNTGVPAGTTLAAYTGPSTITQAGTTIQNVKITSCITLAASANNVTFKNVLFQDNGCYWLLLNTEGATNTIVMDSEFDSLNNSSGDAALAGYNFTLIRDNIHGSVDGLKLGSNDTIQDSYIHDLIIDSESHNDGMQSLGSDNVVIKHNSEILKEGATSCIILSTGAADTMHNIAISNNLFAGGAFSVYAGYEAGVDSASVAGNISLTNNRFSTVIFSTGGAYGPLTSADPPAVTQSGNLWADGPKAGQAI